MLGQLRRGRLPRVLLVVVGAGALAGCKAQVGRVSGRYIVTISDADSGGAALTDPMLPERDAEELDLLTVLSLPLREPATPFAQIEVSNSVLGPPNSLSVSGDGVIACVIEHRGRAAAEATRVEELPAGERLTAVDLSNPLRPVIIGEAMVGDLPMGVDIHPGGDLVAVVTREARKQINILPVSTSGVGEALTWPLLGAENDEAVPSSVAWHPSGEFFAVTIPAFNQVMFYQFTRDAGEGTLGIKPWGAAVGVGKYPYTGRFTPDGRHFITTNVQWGPDVEGFFVESPVGELSVVRFAAEAPRWVEGEEAGLPAHEVVSTATVGINPAGLAISRDGTLVVTANVQRSFLPETSLRMTREGSLTLLRLDVRTGRLTAVDEYTFDAMPVGLAFDAADRYVVVTQFRSFDAKAKEKYGELGFWRVRRGLRPGLEKPRFWAGVGKGPHGVLIIR